MVYKSPQCIFTNLLLTPSKDMTLASSHHLKPPPTNNVKTKLLLKKKKKI